MKIIKVKASTPYEVVIANDYSSLREKIKEFIKGKVAVVYDENTYRIFSNEIRENLSGLELFEKVFKEGENTKSQESYFSLLEFLADNEFSRQDVILAVGGGVIGDLCGFVASTYMRGIGYISCPTTLLSCVDSSVGGKTAINLPQGKNLVGSFYQPKLVYCSLSALKTLPQREIECGMGEVIKYAFLDESVKKEDVLNGISADLIYKCVDIKRKIVELDEFDRGERAKLNLGHTIGHAVESLSCYSFSHGLCVAKGIDKIIDISCNYYGYGEEKKREFKDLLNCYPFDTEIGFSANRLIEKILVDKKKVKDAINFVLIKEIGCTEIVKIPLSKLEGLLK